ncbi:SLAP domain-containing protein [Schleiferilactobacillus shenzhenensis]|uniref:Uncharacterized protein n=1 Tax=Schleiferilactobacillus shenzhenensis LY-73 TaxID=1231336 RepID=U4TU93_9LACO|nr:SLAP domain-containing protein [Schleiferilactobacillus shenzhenensis]ERL65443.1 hypothetical protein L248_2516 [Schleiferilactobacillus shenzhenensis LY-73]
MSHSKALISLGVGAAALAGTLAIGHGEAQAATTGVTTYTEGSTTVWQSPSFYNSKPARYLAPGQKVTIQSSQTINGTTWYQVGTNEWVPSTYMKVADDAAAAQTAAQPAAATDQGNVKVNYQDGATTVWTSPTSNKVSSYLGTGQVVPYTESVKQTNLTWYHVASGWVPSAYVSPVGDQAPQTQTNTQTTSQQAPTAANLQVQNVQASTNTTARSNQNAGQSATVKVSFYDPAVLGSSMGYGGVAANLAKYPKGTRLKIVLADGTTLHRTVNDTGTFVYSNPNQIDLAWPNASIPSYGVTTATITVE